jgi:phenylalanyl-tRNA synthetase alpha subunit
MNQNNSHAHPMTLLIDKVCKIFTNMGFDITDGPELERE